jgi:hypothetical protein
MAMVYLMLAGFGVSVVYSTGGYLPGGRRKGDAGVYFRAAWAARTGGNLYTITDNNDWNYVYPPLLAILLIPLAEPPPSVTDATALPFALSIGIWYALSIGLLIGAVDMLARALGSRWPASWVAKQKRFGFWWWMMCAAPIFWCMLPLGRSLARGQVGMLLLFLLCGMAAALLRRQSWRAGLWLAGAICLKIIPAFLLLYPLWRRDGRCLAGCTAGLIIGLVIIPVIALGPGDATNAYRSLYQEMIVPALGGGTADGKLSSQLTGISATDSNSLMAVLNNMMHLELHPRNRPRQVATWMQAAHWLLVLMLTLITLIAAGWRKTQVTSDFLVIPLFLSGLMLVHLIASPIFHPHYLALSVLPTMALLVAAWQRDPFPDLSLRWWLFLIAGVVLPLLTVIQGFDIFRDIGLVLWGALLLWLVTIMVLWRRVRQRADGQPG